MSLNSSSKIPKKALLIGINYDAWPVFNLHGCHADVYNAKNFLLKIGMEERNIRVLTDEDDQLAPTKAAILAGFRWVQKGAQDGDVLYIHYSGHGVETDPPSDNPLDRASSKAICPIDVFHKTVDEIEGRWDYNSLTFVNEITGEDFKGVFGHLEDTKVNLTVVYDCCHSTGAMRAIGVPGEPKETTARGIPVPRAHRKLAKQVEKKTDELGETSGTRGALDKQFEHRYAPEELVPKYVIGFAAAQGWEPAIDARNSSGPCGAFSYYFYALLNKEAKNLNGQGIIDSVNKSLKTNNYTQTPSITTSKKLVASPLFADLSSAQRSLGDVEKLSAVRKIEVEPLNEEADMIARERKIKKGKGSKDESSKTNKPKKNHSSDDDEKPAAKPAKTKKPKSDCSSDEEKANGAKGKKPAKCDSDDESENAGASKGKGASGNDAAATEHVRNVVNTYTQIAQSKELQKMRQQDRGLFDSLLQHAVPFALNAAQAAVKALASGSGKRDVGSEIAIRQHLPTAINFAHQVMAIPEVQADTSRGFFDKIFSIGMPLVINTAQSLLGAKRGLAEPSASDDEAQRGLFSSIISSLPGKVFNVLSEVMNGNRGIEGEDRGFLDILKKVAPIVLNVASTAVNSLVGQRSLSFPPTDRGFFDSLKNVVSKVVNNPIVQKIGSTALDLGIQVATNALSGQRGLGEAPAKEYTEAHVRGFFGSLLQTLTPIAMGALQGAVGAIGGKRDLSVPQDRGIFDIISQALPAVVQIAQQAFSQNRGLASPNEGEAEYLQRVLASASGPLIAAAREQVANRTTDRGIIGSIIGTLLPF